MDILSEVWKQVPSLGVLALVVYWFLQDRRLGREHLDQIAETCHRLQRETTAQMTKCIDKNTKSSDQSIMIQGQVLEIMRKFNGKK